MAAADYRIMTDATGLRIAEALETQSIDKAAKTDLTSIIATGTTNATGATIGVGTYFYLNGTLVQAKADIASGAQFTSGTNYEAVTAGGLNSLANNEAKYAKAITVTALNAVDGQYTAPASGFLKVICVKDQDTNNSDYRLSVNGETVLRYTVRTSYAEYFSYIIPLNAGSVVKVEICDNMYGLSTGNVKFIPRF